MQDRFFAVLTPLVVTAVMVTALWLGLRPPADHAGIAPAAQVAVSAGAGQIAVSDLATPGDS